MLTLLAVCYLGGQMLFSVPQGWHVTEVYSGGHAPLRQTRTLGFCDAACEANQSRPFVRLTRTIMPGERVTAPEGYQSLDILQEKVP